MNYLSYLKKYYDYDEFKNNQEKIIDSLMNNAETIAILKTGGGKSVCFQIPGLIKEGLTIVITPLISLMVDQVLDLKRKQIKATYINSEMDYYLINDVYNNLDKYKFLYISPERLNNDHFKNKIKRVKISQIIIDEAHSISVWGKSFRKAYLDIKSFIDLFDYEISVGAFTATASKKVIDDIITILDFKNPTIINSFDDRKELFYMVLKEPNKFKFIINFLSKHRMEKTIIYCLTRRRVEDLYNKLIKYRINAYCYHGGLDIEIKKENQTDFTNNCGVMIATNAFGMGINIIDIKNVILYEMPMSIEDLAQEWGRTARKLEEGNCILLYDEKDISTVEYLIESADEYNDIKEKKKEFRKVLEFSNSRRCFHYELTRNFYDIEEYRCDKCNNCVKLCKNRKMA